jgi:hypothetical protein
MQTVSRYLLSQLLIAYVNGYHGRNSKVYDRRLTLHRGVSNPVTFTFKNEDQKAQDISAKTVASGNYYELNVIDSETSKSVITKTLTPLDDGSTLSTKGQATCTITEGDLLSLDAKFYNYAVREVKTDGSREVTYSDTGYSASGTIELLDGAYPQFVPSTSVSAFTLSGETFTSSDIPARPGINNNKALHTIAIYPNNFSGTVRVEATMVGTSPTDDDYFAVTSTDLTSESAVSSLNFTGVYQNVRFIAVRTADTTGRIDKILYRQ